MSSLLLGLLAAVPASAENGSICVAPLRLSPQLPQPIGRMPPPEGEAPAGQGAAASVCGASLCIKIDGTRAVPWPAGDGFRLDDVALTGRHRVTLIAGGTPDQSFVFRFSEYKTKRLCLFIHELYGTAQLWQAKDAPWCKCR